MNWHDLKVLVMFQPFGQWADTKKAPEGAFFEGMDGVQSRSPPMMPSRANKLWKMLNTLRYRAKVALM